MPLHLVEKEIVEESEQVEASRVPKDVLPVEELPEVVEVPELSVEAQEVAPAAVEVTRPEIRMDEIVEEAVVSELGLFELTTQEEAEVELLPEADLPIRRELERITEVIEYDILEEALPFIDFSDLLQPDLENHDDGDESPAPIVEQLYEYIETLEPKMAVEAEAILDTMLETIALLYEEDNPAEEDIELRLEVICERLLVCMGIEPSPEVVKNLILVLKKEYLEQAVEVLEVIDEGTHEKKHSIGQVLQDLPGIHPLSAILGRYTLQLAA